MCSHVAQQNDRQKNHLTLILNKNRPKNWGKGPCREEINPETAKKRERKKKGP